MNKFENNIGQNQYMKIGIVVAMSVLLISGGLFLMSRGGSSSISNTEILTVLQDLTTSSRIDSSIAGRYQYLAVDRSTKAAISNLETNNSSTTINEVCNMFVDNLWKEYNGATLLDLSRLTVQGDIVSYIYEPDSTGKILDFIFRCHNTGLGQGRHNSIQIKGEPSTCKVRCYATQDLNINCPKVTDSSVLLENSMFTVVEHAAGADNVLYKLKDVSNITIESSRTYVVNNATKTYIKKATYTLENVQSSVIYIQANTEAKVIFIGHNNKQVKIHVVNSSGDLVTPTKVEVIWIKSNDKYDVAKLSDITGDIATKFEKPNNGVYIWENQISKEDKDARRKHLEEVIRTNSLT